MTSNPLRRINKTGLIYLIIPKPRPTEWQGALSIEDAGWSCRCLVISPAGYLLYVLHDRGHICLLGIEELEENGLKLQN